MMRWWIRLVVLTALGLAAYTLFGRSDGDRPWRPLAERPAPPAPADAELPKQNAREADSLEVEVAPPKPAPQISALSRRRADGLGSPFAPSLQMEGYARIHGLRDVTLSANPMILAAPRGADAKDLKTVIATLVGDRNYELFVPPGRWVVRHGDWVVECAVGPGEERAVDFGVAARGRIEIQLVSELAHRTQATVRVLVEGRSSGPSFERLVRLDPRGRAEIEAVPAGLARVSAQVPMGRRADAMILTGSAEIHAGAMSVVALHAPATKVKFVALSEEGAAVAGVRATLRTSLETERTAISDAAGFLHWDHVEPGTIAVLFEHPEFAVAARTVEVRPEEDAEPIKVRLDRGRAVAIVALSTDGQPLETELHLRGEVLGRAFEHRIHTDPEGRVVVSHWPRDVRRADVHARAALPQLGVSMEPLGTEPIRLRFERTGAL